MTKNETGGFVRFDSSSRRKGRERFSPSIHSLLSFSSSLVRLVHKISRARMYVIARLLIYRQQSWFLFWFVFYNSFIPSFTLIFSIISIHFSRFVLLVIVLPLIVAIDVAQIHSLTDSLPSLSILFLFPPLPSTPLIWFSLWFFSFLATWCAVCHTNTHGRINDRMKWMKRMNEWMNRQMDEWMSEWANEWEWKRQIRQLNHSYSFDLYGKPKHTNHWAV